MAWLVLNPVELSSPFPVKYDDGMLALLAVFRTKKQALKYGNKLIEVEFGKKYEPYN